MSTLTLLIAGGSLFYATCLTPSKAFKELEVDITVQDEQGNPVEDARVHTSYIHWLIGSPLARPFVKSSETFEASLTRYTDARGMCKLRFHTWSPGASIGVTKEGWYPSVIKLQDRMAETDYRWTIDAKKIKAYLQKEKHPVPLISCDMNLKNIPHLLILVNRVDLTC